MLPASAERPAVGATIGPAGGAIEAAWWRPPLAELPPAGVLLVTDFDGTLADIVRDPAMASLRPDVAAALPPLVERLRGVVVLSSRDSNDLKRLVPVPGVACLGDYGMGPPTSAERQALARFNEAAAHLVSDLPGVRIEPKSVATSIHFRNSPASGQAVVERLAPLVAAEGLRARTGRLAFEVTLRRASKGESLERLVRQSQPEGVVYLGDDANDKPAFEYMARSPLPSLAVGVGSTEVPDDLFAACDVILPGVAAVPVFLSSLAGWAQRRGASDPRADG